MDPGGGETNRKKHIAVIRLRKLVVTKRGGEATKLVSEMHSFIYTCKNTIEVGRQAKSWDPGIQDPSGQVGNTA